MHSKIFTINHSVLNLIYSSGAFLWLPVSNMDWTRMFREADASRSQFIYTEYIVLSEGSR